MYFINYELVYIKILVINTFNQVNLQHEINKSKKIMYHMKNILCIKITLLLIIAIKLQAYHDSNLPYKAVIHLSVIDMDCTSPHINFSCVSPGLNKKCHRSHQGLYNEMVTCLEEKNDFIKIIFPSIKYNFDKTPSFFWTKKTNIIPLHKIKQKKILQTIPHHIYGEQPTITLILPWKKFSVGTRFKHIPENDTNNNYGIIRSHYTKNKILYDFIPQTHAIKEIQQNTQKSRELFVYIINNLIDTVDTNHPGQVIPYVWGGSSFIHTYAEKNFHQKNNDLWYRPEHHQIHTGYDCSEFVMRMAQIAGLNFPWKTTDMIQKAKKRLTKHDQLKNGDLIWFQGHIMIVSNINNNEVIEARGYPSGYGRIHKIKLHDLFENIETYDDLLHYYYTKKSINLKNSDGKLLKKISSFQLLKLTD